MLILRILVNKDIILILSIILILKNEVEKKVKLNII